MKIILTGGVGYIGSHVVEQLLNKKYEVIILDNVSANDEKRLNKFCKFYKVDINNYKDLDMIFLREKNVDAIFHFAALISVFKSTQEPMKYFDTNIHGTTNLLKICTKYKIHNFIFSSTAAIYGETNELVNEESIKNPINPYGQSKLFAEAAVKNWEKLNLKNNFIIFRYFNVCGMRENIKDPTSKKRLYSGNLIPLLNLYLLGKNNSFVVYGNTYDTRDGTCLRDYIHVVDLADAHVLGFEWLNRNKKSNIFNLGSKKGFTVNEVIETARKILNIDISVKIVKPRPGDPAKLISDNEKAKKILGWQPKLSLEDMIKSDYEFRK